MSEKKSPRISRFFGFILFRLIPLVLTMSIVWFSYGVAQAVARYVGEQQAVSGKGDSYTQTLSAILPTLTTFTPTPSNTPTQTATSTNTHTATATYTATATLTPSTTPTNTATITQTASPTATATPTALVVAQIFATNTPHSADITLPPLNTTVPTSLPVAAATLTPTPTPSFAPTATLTLLPAIDTTPRPLPTLFIYEPDSSSASAPTAIPTRLPAIDRQGYDLVNILLLGGDAELTNDNFTRTDTMIIVSINRTTNTVSMLSLPRDLFVYIPGWTMQRLNLAYVRGEQVGWTDGGFGLMRQTIFYNLGINVHYYAIINLSGFKEVINTLGGVDVAVDCAIQDYALIGANPPAEAIAADEFGLKTLPVGYYRLDGDGALWYARSRKNSSDFDRGRRQMQILRAIWREARASGQITKLPELWSQLTNVVETNLAFEDMLGLLPLGLSLDPARIENFTFARLYHTTPWQPPDGSFVQIPNAEPVLELMRNFYQPPTENQALVEGARIRIFNGTTYANWDRVAADRLAYDGFIAIASGAAETTDYTDTLLIDYTGKTKGSSLSDIAGILNVKPENIISQPDPNREADFDVFIGSNYNSCTAGGVLPVEETEG